MGPLQIYFMLEILTAVPHISNPQRALFGNVTSRRDHGIRIQAVFQLLQDVDVAGGTIQLLWIEEVNIGPIRPVTFPDQPSLSSAMHWCAEARSAWLRLKRVAITDSTLRSSRTPKVMPICLSNCLATVSTMWLTPSRCFPENGNAGRTAHHPEPEWLSRLINRNRRFGKSP